MSTKVQLTGGAFQDVEGNVLANGYLLMELSQDARVTTSPTAQLAAGVIVKILLDSSGNISTSPAQSIWPNDVLTPANTFYNVSGYTAQGQLVWGPNAQQVLSSPSPYDIGAWRPNISNLAAPLTQTTYDVGVYFPGTFGDAYVMLLLVLDRAVTFATNLVPSTAICGVNPAGAAVISLLKNGTQFGTITFSTGGVPSIVSSGAMFSAGDVLKIVSPPAADITFANVGIILSGLITG